MRKKFKIFQLPSVTIDTVNTHPLSSTVDVIPARDDDDKTSKSNIW